MTSPIIYDAAGAEERSCSGQRRQRTASLRVWHCVAARGCMCACMRVRGGPVGVLCGVRVGGMKRDVMLALAVYFPLLPQAPLLSQSGGNVSAATPASGWKESNSKPFNAFRITDSLDQECVLDNSHVTVSASA
jgi:hypothetical protein